MFRPGQTGARVGAALLDFHACRCGGDARRCCERPLDPAPARFGFAAVFDTPWWRGGHRGAQTGHAINTGKYWPCTCARHLPAVQFGSFLAARVFHRPAAQRPWPGLGGLALFGRACSHW